MTSISPISQPSLPAFRVPSLLRAVGYALFLAAIVLVAGVGLLACLTIPADLSDRLRHEIVARIEALGDPQFSCGVDGEERREGQPNCLDHRGFRVVKGADLLVFSMRYDKPLFVFGIGSGLMFTNEKISDRLLDGERSAFVGYVTHDLD